MSRVKYGRKARIHDARVPHLYEVRRRLGLVGPTTPAAPVDYTLGLTGLGMMLNDQLGDCTCAAVYHRRQVVTAQCNPPMDTQPDAQVRAFYERFGYVPGDSNTDQGAVEQEVLADWLQQGIPLADGTTNKLVSFIEIGVANALDIDWAITDCLGVYIGFNVPQFLEDGLTAPGSVWDADPAGDQAIIGGHAVYVAGHLAGGNRRLISWGATYEITPAFWNQFVDEVYVLVDDDLVCAKTGQTLLGLTIDQTAAAMAAFAQAA